MKFRRILPGKVSQYTMSIRQFYPENRPWQNSRHPTFCFNSCFSGHVKISGSDAVIKTVCSK